MDSEFSSRPLLALLQSGVHVRAVVKPLGGLALRRSNFSSRVPRLMTRLRDGWQRLWHQGLGRQPVPADSSLPDDPFVLAERWGLPCYVVGDASGPRALKLLKKLDADLFCIAFFNQILRAPCLAIPRLGAMNLHPSLLPAYRGPAPLFWTFKDALRETGVTLHLLAPGEDDGDVLCQSTIPIHDGMRGWELVTRMAGLGARMMVQGVWDVFHGRAAPTPQAKELAFRRPRPKGHDLCVDFSQSANQVFNFVRGVSAWVPLYAQLGQDRVDVVDVLDVRPGEHVPGDWTLVDSRLVVQCADGAVVLHVRPQTWTAPRLTTQRSPPGSPPTRRRPPPARI
jgi:methionyl-tRNA formyltransferase